jgi:hypothetical protein
MTTTGPRPQEDFMEDYDDAVGQAHQEDLLRQQEIEEDLGLFSPVYVLQASNLPLRYSISKAWRLSKWT